LLLGQYDGADKQYTEALESYDQDMRDKNKERDETRADLEDQEDQLRQIREQWAERREEARKRENLQAILDKKKEIQRKETDTLNQASKFLQAHYRGMLARREQERSRKGKKGKRRKK
jgi:septal ring factor EnvC (AmiA/AmiB activator)